MDVSSIPRCASIWHSSILLFDKKKTLSFKAPTAKPPTLYLKDDGNKNFVVIKCKDFQFD